MFKKIFIRPFVPAMAAVAVLLFLVVGAADKFIMPWVAGRFTPTVRVPKILGVERNQAGTNLAALGLILMLDSAGELSVDVPKGAVMFQFPEAGAEVKKGRRIWARLSKGLKGFETPVLRGMSLRQAQISLEQSGLTLGRVSYLRSTTVPTGAVLGSTPSAGSVVMHGGKVDVDISLGSESMPPDLERVKN